MIYELRTYTLKQGSVPDVVKAASTISRDIRKDDYGKLEGYWITEIGPLNQVLHLWSYTDLNERARLRADLGKNARWNSEYVPLIRPNLVRQDIRLLNAVRAPVAPAKTPNVYELRCYRARPGAGARSRGWASRPNRISRWRSLTAQGPSTNTESVHEQPTYRHGHIPVHGHRGQHQTLGSASCPHAGCSGSSRPHPEEDRRAA